MLRLEQVSLTLLQLAHEGPLVADFALLPLLLHLSWLGTCRVLPRRAVLWAFGSSAVQSRQQ